MYSEKNTIRLCILLMTIAFWVVYSIRRTHQHQVITSSTDISDISNTNTNTGYNKNMQDNLTTGSNIGSSSEMQIVYEDLEAIGRLKAKYQYILKSNINSGTIYMIKLKPERNVDDILSGYVHKIITGSAITQAQMIGDRIIYFNLADWKNQIVVFIWELNTTDKRLVQVDYDIYHQSKIYMKQNAFK